MFDVHYVDIFDDLSCNHTKIKHFRLIMHQWFLFINFYFLTKWFDK